MEKEIIRKTFSVCPKCLKRIPAYHVKKDNNVYLNKKCDEHGFFSTIIWKGKTSKSDWMGDTHEIGEGENLNCPNNCGICSEHLQGTCCTLLEVTKRCNLNCKFCFADERNNEDIALEQIKAWINDLTVKGKTLLQLSGGEPTVRDDLPEIVQAAKLAGCKYIQLNSNGIRLGNDIEYVKKLADSGLSFVFMQFDGTENEIYRKLRRGNYLEIKKKAIENCAKYNIGVTLVPMIVPGVNVHNIGEILKFAIKNSPNVRGVHFQPVSYFGRVPRIPSDDMRFTLDELLFEIESQTNGMIKMKNLLPSCCDHPSCGFHGDFVVLPNGISPISIKKAKKSDCCCSSSVIVSADKNREFVGRRWKRPVKTNENKVTSCCSEKHDIHDMNYFLNRIKSHGFTVTAMAFQDAGNLDLERLRRCSLHVYDNGLLVPFCSHYLTPWEEI